MAAAVVALASAGAASADNSNSNSNNNDVTNVVGSAVTGRPSNENANWPPTDLSWPPNEIMNSGAGESDGNDSSGSTPIVMPTGQPAPTKTATPSTQQAQPIVPVNTP